MSDDESGTQLDLAELGRAAFDDDETADLLERIERASRVVMRGHDASAVVAGMTYDSMLDAEWLVRMRAAPTQRLLAFESDDAVIELTVEPLLGRRQVSGRVSPDGGGASIEVAHRAGQASAQADDAGRFVVDDVPVGVVRIAWRTAGGSRFETPWVAI